MENERSRIMKIINHENKAAYRDKGFGEGLSLVLLEVKGAVAREKSLLECPRVCKRAIVGEEHKRQREATEGDKYLQDDSRKLLLLYVVDGVVRDRHKDLRQHKQDE